MGKEIYRFFVYHKITHGSNVRIMRMVLERTPKENLFGLCKFV